MAGDTYLVNFQLAATPAPARYLVDGGAVFGPRGGGLSYGWSTDHTDQARTRIDVETGNFANPDVRLTTLVHFEAGQRWEFALPNGQYQVTAAIGDPEFDSIYTLNVEGVNYWNAVPLSGSSLQMTSTVTVNDGRLTLDQGAAGEKATRINFVHIVGIPSGPNLTPNAPTITEPDVDGKIVNPADVHMEAVGYLDPDGNQHKSTDWEIWTTGPNPEPVWQTLGIGGVERLHTHLGDGVYINARAGFTSLEANTPYELRVRYRDDAGSVSPFASRLFQTGAANSVFAREIEGVSSSVEPLWVDLNGGAINLPTSATPSLPALEVANFDFSATLLRIAATAAPGNAVTNFPTLSEHSPIRLTIRAGSLALTLPETLLTLADEHGDLLDVFLPSINLPAGQRLDLWVASTGATYYGTSSQTTPTFTSLAKAASIAVPFTAYEQNFVIEEVGNGYRLPVNIAFVPNPGPNPSDPLYYVTELYGSIQVVSRDGTKRQFATGLLDYNPQGPISGSGEQGLTGIAVERDPANPETYVVYVGMLADNGAPPGASTHYPKVEKLTSTSGGLTLATRTVLLNMQPETQGQSHQISNISIGPDGKLYVHNGDGFNASTAQNLAQFRGKILRLNKDGSAPSDNPFYNAADGITARDYVFASGVRNPFGGAWRAADGKHYSVENGPSVDRFAQINRGVNYGYNGSDTSMRINALYNWSPATAPVNITFVQPETFAGSQFPQSLQGRAFVSESGATYAAGPQTSGKKVTQFTLGPTGAVLSGPTPFAEYVGAGRSTVVALAAGPDGLYFSEFYEETGASGATAAGSRIFRIRYLNPLQGDYDIDGVVDADDYTVWKNNFGSNLLLAADGNRNGVVDAGDYTVWRDNLGATLASISAESALSDEALAAISVDQSPMAPSPSDLAFAALISSEESGPQGSGVRPEVSAASAYATDLLLLYSLQGAEDDETDGASEEKVSLNSGETSDAGPADEAWSETSLLYRLEPQFRAY